MKTEKKNFFPDYCMFFNPNWYSHQIFDCNKNEICAVGCNDEAQIIDIKMKKMITSLYIKIPPEIVIKDNVEKKITAIFINENYVIFTLMKGLMAIFKYDESNNFENIFTGMLQYQDQISYIKEISSDENTIEFVLADTKSLIIFAKYSDGVVEQDVLLKQGKTATIKFFDYFKIGNENILLKIDEEGGINLWSTYFDDLYFSVDTNLLFVNINAKQFGNIIIISGITKTNYIFLAEINLLKVIELYAESTDIVEPSDEVFKVVLNIEYSIELNKINTDVTNIKIFNKVEVIDNCHIIIAAKDGAIYYIDAFEIAKSNINKLNLFQNTSIDDSNGIFECLDENPHKNNLYFTGTYNNTLVVIGMDRIISFWNILDFSINYNFSIKCLSSKVTQIKSSKNNILLVCKDKSLRIWDINRKNNYFYSNIITKNLNNKIINDLIYHKKDEGVAACISNNEIFLYNLYGNNLVSAFNVKNIDNAKFSSFLWINKKDIELFLLPSFSKIFISILNSDLYKNYNSKINNLKCGYIKYNTEFKTNLNNDYSLLTFSNYFGFLFFDFNLGNVFEIKTGLEGIITASNFINLDDINVTFFVLGDKRGNVIIIRMDQNSIYYYIKENCCNNNITGITFSKYNKDSTTLKFAVGSNERIIELFEISNVNEQKINRNVIVNYGKIAIPNKINQMQYSPFNDNIFMNTCFNDISVRIWNICNNNDYNSSPALINQIFGHKGFITAALFPENNPNYIVTAADDQTIKIWDFTKRMEN